MRIAYGKDRAPLLPQRSISPAPPNLKSAHNKDLGAHGPQKLWLHLRPDQEQHHHRTEPCWVLMVRVANRPQRWD